MAVIERPNGTIHYRFPMSRKVRSSVVGANGGVGAADVQKDSGLLEGYSLA